jgi:hypothetical protein
MKKEGNMKPQFVSRIIPLLFLPLISLPPSIYSQTSEFNWVGQVGGPTNDIGSDLVQDVNGNIFWTGQITDTCTFLDTTIVAGFADAFLAKTSENGDHQWIQIMSGSGWDRGYGLAIDGQSDIIIVGVFGDSIVIGDTLLVGQYYSEVFIAKFSNNGNFLWAVHGGGQLEDYALCVAVDGQDNILVGGYYEKELTLGNINWQNPYSTEHSFLAKISPAGHVLWGWTNLNSLDDNTELLSVATDNQDNIVVSGQFDGQITIGNDTLTSYSDDIYTIKFLPNGTILWKKQIGGDNSDYVGSVVCDNQQNIYITGTFGDSISLGNNTFKTPDGGTDAFLAKISPIGDFIWSYQVSGTHDQETYGIAYNIYSGIAITGSFFDNILFGNDNFTGKGSFAAQFSESGNFLNFAGTIGSNNDYGAAILLDDWDNCYFTGRFHGTCVFGDTTLISKGTADGFLSRVYFDNTNAVNVGISITTEYTLLQNYPNPFNPITNIEFSIPKSKFVTLKVYNILGEEVATLVSEKLNAGKYKYDWNAGSLASGVYLYRLQTGEYIETKKMILMR